MVRDIKGGFKIIYSSEDAKGRITEVLQVIRISERLIVVKINVGNRVCNIISTYAS